MQRDAFVQQNCLGRGGGAGIFGGSSLSLLLGREHRFLQLITALFWMAIVYEVLLQDYIPLSLTPYAVLLEKHGREPVDGNLAKLPISLGKGQPSAAM